MTRWAREVQGKGESSSDESVEAADDALEGSQQKTAISKAWYSNFPTTLEGMELGIRSDGNTEVGWINGRAKQTTTVDAERPETNNGMVGQRRRSTKKS